EASCRNGVGREDFCMSVIGADGNLGSKLYVAIEYLYNGGGLGTETQGFDYSSEVVTMNKNFFGLSTSFELNPLLYFSMSLIHDIDGESGVISPSLIYNMLPELDVVLGTQFYLGGSEGEFGDVNDTYFLLATFYF
ncbi:MAG: hypothetical protein KAR06_06795, partial [Deltaproteobacteria bacterium]|nr:hypothetical protein [Deltaproteobacteria bacterium]